MSPPMRATPVREALLALRPGEDVAEDAAENVAENVAEDIAEDAAGNAHGRAFQAVADLLLNRATLFIAGVPHRLTEIEVYWDGPGHRDPFTHGDVLQKQAGTWYFHRQGGGAYKAGTYKGVDVAFGSEAAFGGILVRGAREIGGAAGTGAILDGSCVFVDHVLARAGAASIADLLATFDASVDAPEEGGASPLYLALDEAAGERLPVYASSRVGLTLKKGPTEARQRFLARRYRFLTAPEDIRKGRAQIVVALHGQGMDEREIAAVTGVSRGNVGKYVRAYEGGKLQDPAAFAGELSTEDLCALLGACAQRFGGDG